MSACVSKNLSGIGSILGSDCETTTKISASLRRTLSADMSSKKWLTQQGLKKIASSEELQIISEFDMWNSEGKKKDLDQTQNFDMWNSIVSQQSSSSSMPAPYIHPLTKRSRSLSEKSLEICTESLGSETGSDGFSSYSPSEASDGEQDQDEHEEMAEKEVTEHKFVSFCNKKSTRRSCSFPPPLPSLSLHMRSHRQDGRLVLNAIPATVSSQKYFHSQRENGRLLLTFINSPEEIEIKTQGKSHEENNNGRQQVAQAGDYVQDEVGDEEEEFEEDDNYGSSKDVEEDEEEEITKVEEQNNEEKGTVLDVREPNTKMPTRVINVHRSVLMVNKLMGLTNRDPTATWSPKLQTDPTPLPQSLPSKSRIARLIPATATTAAAAAASFNTYEYCWRSKTPTSPTKHSQSVPKNKFFFTKNINPEDEHKLLLLKGNKAEYLSGCKEPRRSLLIWEPYCIATS